MNDNRPFVSPLRNLLTFHSNGERGPPPAFGCHLANDPHSANWGGSHRGSERSKRLLVTMSFRDVALRARPTSLIPR
jgi:hypothetical protein